MKSVIVAFINIGPTKYLNKFKFSVIYGIEDDEL